MANTVIAIFEDTDSAHHAERYLLEQGFERSKIILKTAFYKQEATVEDEQNPDWIRSFTAFFKDLFGDDDQKQSTCTAAGSNRTIVTVHTSTDQDADDVSSILDHYGAIHVAEAAGSHSPDNYSQLKEQATAIKSRIIKRSV